MLLCSEKKKKRKEGRKEGRRVCRWEVFCLAACPKYEQICPYCPNMDRSVHKIRGLLEHQGEDILAHHPLSNAGTVGNSRQSRSQLLGIGRERITNDQPTVEVDFSCLGLEFLGAYVGSITYGMGL